MRGLRVSLVAAVVSALLTAPLPHASAQAPSPPIHYVYDELNRLVAVIDRDNNAAAYVYDAVGNILAIERFDLADIPGNVGITFVAPGKGKVGVPVVIYGKGFGTSAAQVSVAFNGTSATVGSVSANRISTSVPAGATTGPVTVTAPLGTAISPKAFRVLGPITIDPPSANLGLGGTVQFTARAGGGAAVAAFWEVNGIRGGNAAFGTISSAGLYTAPTGLSAPPSVTITALDTDDVATTATAAVTILPPITATAVARGVSVGVAAPRVVDKSVTALVSVLVTGAPTTSAAAPGVGVRLDAPAPAFAAAAPTSVAIAPVITAVVPAAGARGALSMFVTIAGSGLTDATQLTFLRNNAPDATIAVANFAVNGDGTQATAELTIASGAATGVRAVRITTPAGASTAVGTGGNLFTVQ